jgi:hypothetical protein
LISDLFGKRLYAVSGAVNYDYVENAIIFKASGDITDPDDRGGISDTLQFQVTRSDANAGDIAVTFFDLHGKVDSDGSNNETSKT